MGQCVVCREFIPPDFMMEDKKCAFCTKGQNVLFGPNGEMYNKQEVVYDYKVLLGELKDAQSVQDAYIKCVVRREGLE